MPVSKKYQTITNNYNKVSLPMSKFEFSREDVLKSSKSMIEKIYNITVDENRLLNHVILYDTLNKSSICTTEDYIDRYDNFYKYEKFTVSKLKTPREFYLKYLLINEMEYQYTYDYEEKLLKFIYSAEKQNKKSLNLLEKYANKFNIKLPLIFKYYTFDNLIDRVKFLSINKCSRIDVAKLLCEQPNLEKVLDKLDTKTIDDIVRFPYDCHASWDDTIYYNRIFKYIDTYRKDSKYYIENRMYLDETVNKWYRLAICRGCHIPTRLLEIMNMCGRYRVKEVILQEKIMTIHKYEKEYRNFISKYLYDDVEIKEFVTNIYKWDWDGVTSMNMDTGKFTRKSCNGDIIDVDKNSF